MTNKELSDIQHMIEAKIKKTNDFKTHIMILITIIGISLCAATHYLNPPVAVSTFWLYPLVVLVVICFATSVMIGMSRIISTHEYEKYLENLEDSRSKGLLPQIDTEKFIALFLEHTKPKE